MLWRFELLGCPPLQMRRGRARTQMGQLDDAACRGYALSR
jgi:hypothetical protein